MKTRIAVIMMLLAFGLAQAPTTASAQRLRIRLTTLHCNDAQEESLFSNGDEPYVICATITQGGLLGRTLTFQRTGVYHDVQDGSDRAPNLDLFNAAPLNSVVVVAQVVEHDDSTVDFVYNLAKGVAQNAFANALLNGTNDLWQLGNIVATALHSGVVSAALPLVDDDDAIGAAAIFITPLATFNQMANNTSFTLLRQVAGNDARYTLTFVGTRLP